MSVTINPEALTYFTRSPEGPVGLLIAAKTETVYIGAREKVRFYMEGSTGKSPEELVGSHLDVGTYGPQGHVGTIGSKRYAKYLAQKENLEGHEWLVPALKSAGFVEA